MDFVFPTTLSVSSLTALVAAGPPAGLLNGAVIELFQNDIVPSPSTLLADYTLADYDGYAAEAITWGAVSISDDGDPEVIGIAGEFRPTGATTPNAIYGCLILSGAGALLAAARFDDAPLPMNAVTDVIIVTPRVRQPSEGLGVVVS